MNDVIMCEFRKYDLTIDIWSALKEIFKGILVANLKAPTMN